MPDVPEEDRRRGGDGGIVSKFDVKVIGRVGVPTFLEVGYWGPSDELPPHNCHPRQPLSLSLRLAATAHASRDEMCSVILIRH